MEFTLPIKDTVRHQENGHAIMLHDNDVPNKQRASVVLKCTIKVRHTMEQGVQRTVYCITVCNINVD